MLKNKEDNQISKKQTFMTLHEAKYFPQNENGNPKMIIEASNSLLDIPKKNVQPFFLWCTFAFLEFLNQGVASKTKMAIRSSA